LSLYGLQWCYLPAGGAEPGSLTLLCVRTQLTVGSHVAQGGASAERMYRTLTDPGYQKATNKHGCRLNPRSGTAMHVMATYALRQMPGAQRAAYQMAGSSDLDTQLCKQRTAILSRMRDLLWLPSLPASRVLHICGSLVASLAACCRP